jgi:ApaG protein
MSPSTEDAIDLPEGVDLVIEVKARYLPEQSEPEQHRYAFAYTVRMSNRGRVSARLVDRHWIITDGTLGSDEVRGPGVVGETPRLEPGQGFEYTSGAVLRSPAGCMRGSYGWITDDRRTFRTAIAEFVLSMPRVLH